MSISSHSESSFSNIHEASNNLADIIREAIENQTHLASEKSILLNAPPVTVSDPVNCDRDRVAQILSNLIGNAIEAINVEA